MTLLQTFMRDLIHNLEEHEEEQQPLQRVSPSPVVLDVPVGTTSSCTTTTATTRPIKSILKTKTISYDATRAAISSKNVTIVGDNARSFSKPHQKRRLPSQRSPPATTAASTTTTTTSHALGATGNSINNKTGAAATVKTNRWIPISRQESDSCLNVPKRGGMGIRANRQVGCAGRDSCRQRQLPPNQQQRPTLEERSMSDSALTVPTRKASPVVRGGHAQGLTQKILVKRLEELPLLRPTRPTPTTTRSTSPPPPLPAATPLLSKNNRSSVGSSTPKKQMPKTATTTTTGTTSISLLSCCETMIANNKDHNSKNNKDNKTRSMSSMILEKRKKHNGHRGDWGLQKFQEQQMNHTYDRQMIQSTLQWLLDGSMDDTMMETRLTTTTTGEATSAASDSTANDEEDGNPLAATTMVINKNEIHKHRTLPTPTPFIVPL